MNNNNIEFPIIYNEKLEKEDFVEWMTEVMRARIKKPFIAVVILSILFYAIVAMSLIMNVKTVSSFYIILVSVCLVIALFFRNAVGNLLGNLRYKQYCLANNSSKSIVAFYEERLEIKVGEEVVTVLKYSDITKIVFTKHLLIIVFPHLTNCIVRQDGFTEDDFEIVQAYVTAGKK